MCVPCLLRVINEVVVIDFVIARKNNRYAIIILRDGVVDYIVPLNQIAAEIIQRVGV